MQLRKNKSQNSSLKKCKSTIKNSSIDYSLTSDVPKELEFIKYENLHILRSKQQLIDKNSANKRQLKDLINSENTFTAQQREILKNGFRYICRLAFKQALQHKNDVHQIAEQINEQIKNRKIIFQQSTDKQNRKSVCQAINFDLFENAQLISGQRYFQEYIEGLDFQQKQILLKYMLWFLKRKYLRHIHNCHNNTKGKRKQMNKTLYIRFKNQFQIQQIEKKANQYSSQYNNNQQQRQQQQQQNYQNQPRNFNSISGIGMGNQNQNKNQQIIPHIKFNDQQWKKITGINYDHFRKNGQRIEKQIQKKVELIHNSK